jgi:hypothetical protein
VRTARIVVRASSNSSANASPNDATHWANATPSLRPEPPYSLVTGLRGDGLPSEQPPSATSSSQDPAPGGTQVAEISREFATPILPRPIEVTRARFIVLGAWECVVEQVLDDTFIARIVDLDEATPDEMVELYKSDLSDEDLGLLEEQAVLYWFVGYNDTDSGQRSRSSVLRVRRLPPWTAEEDEQAQAWADETGEQLKWPK